MESKYSNKIDFGYKGLNCKALKLYQQVIQCFNTHREGVINRM